MTKRRAAVRSLLSDLEHDVMHAVWQAGEATVEAVHDIVAKRRDLKEVTTRTILRRLEHKGYLRHEVSGRAYIYRAVEQPRSLAARAVRQLIDRFCRGSVDELVTGLVEADVLSEAELAALERSIRAHNAGPAGVAKATATRRSRRSTRKGD
jgi:BlaI family transcriptional regulator, penicillinase repressor